MDDARRTIGDLLDRHERGSLDRTQLIEGLVRLTQTSGSAPGEEDGESFRAVRDDHHRVSRALPRIEARIAGIWVGGRCLHRPDGSIPATAAKICSKHRHLGFAPGGCAMVGDGKASARS